MIRVGRRRRIFENVEGYGELTWMMIGILGGLVVVLHD